LYLGGDGEVSCILAAMESSTFFARDTEGVDHFQFGAAYTFWLN
jgi:hypothetical protein